ncbi:alpha/beta fold hydrolase [Mycolicibacterium arseniciresistens]|uniref:Alpha/beta fold hydrolase n=1 Tax=Mycolicibacterium arseniciresistens TaxID=3062257 RepID=A0ABT8UJL8_9MYCO|nr:alpha/beta fold hydrolase [Mycolicibacterium arseniciresistens]MDO3637987.1 alpha/beta fold hydrolase [Mycolicibacterium arseniciresistens]
MTTSPHGLGDAFTSATARVNGITLHHVSGGSGPAMVLLHGFPQDWYEWRAVMPRLAASHTVVAVDLRGVGESDAPEDGYDATQMADDVFALIDHLGLGAVHLVGHDIGGWVAYAGARRHPQRVLSATILETLIAGTGRFASPGVDVALWHGEFHMVPDLPEALVSGRQRDYFGYFFDIGTRGRGVITDADLDHYVEAYRDGPHLRAAFEMYRAIPRNIVFNDAHRDLVDVPLLLVGGEHVFGATLPDTAEELRSRFGWSDVTVHVVPNGQHYLIEERPDDIVELLLRHARRPRRD